MSLETVNLEHLPDSHKIYVALFRDVQNSAFLHQQLLARNPLFEYAFIDASVVSSAQQMSRSTRLGLRAKLLIPSLTRLFPGFSYYPLSSRLR